MINIKFIKRRYKFILILVVLLTTSVVSAAYSEKLTITGDGYIRVDADVRVNGISATTGNEGYETYNAKYSKEAVYLYTSLPQTNSTVTYEVTIHNKTDNVYVISNEKIIYSKENNIECKINDGSTSKGKVLPKNSDTKISFTCKYKEGTTQVPSDIKQITTIEFTFARPTAEMISYDPSNSKSQCTDVQCALDELYGILGGGYIRGNS